MALFGRNKSRMVTADEALPGRTNSMPVVEHHAVTGHRIVPPFPDGMHTAVFGMGCFWGAERLFWQTCGVYSTAVGYAGGYTPNPTYQEVCTGRTGHAEVVGWFSTLRRFPTLSCYGFSGRVTTRPRA